MKPMPIVLVTAKGIPRLRAILALPLRPWGIPRLGAGEAEIEAAGPLELALPVRVGRTMAGRVEVARTLVEDTRSGRREIAMAVTHCGDILITLAQSSEVLLGACHEDLVHSC
jgi:hypothetical protein